MVSRFVRKVRTKSGAVAVQVVTRQGRQVLGIEHVGSAHTDEDLALLAAAAPDRLLHGQAALDLGEVNAVPTRMADVALVSSGGCNEEVAEGFGGGGVAEGAAGAGVEFAGDVVELCLGDGAEVGDAFGVVVADQAVGVLVGAALPG